MEKSALDAGAQIGAEVIVKAPLADTNVGVQIQLLHAVAAQGAEAIVIAPINKDALAVPIASIAIRGVKIVTVALTRTREVSSAKTKKGPASAGPFVFSRAIPLTWSGSYTAPDAARS